MVAASYPFMDVLWSMVIFFLFVIWIWILITVFADIFRRRDIGGGMKALWIIFVILLPYLGVFIYLIAEGHHMAERNAEQMQRGESAAGRAHQVGRREPRPPTRSPRRSSCSTAARSHRPSSTASRPRHSARTPSGPGSHRRSVRLRAELAQELHHKAPTATHRICESGRITPGRTRSTRRTEAAHVSLARLLGLARVAGGAARQARPLADRPEQALAARRDDHERRRVRRRLVRRARHARRVPRHRAGLERPQPPRYRRPHLLAAHLRPHSRLDRHGGPGDELPSVPPRELALDAQRRDPRLPARQARPRARGRPLALPADRRIDRLGAVLLPRAHARARGQPAARRRAGRRPDRGDGPPPRRRAPDPDDRGDDGRRQHLGLPVLERTRLEVAVLQHRRCRPSAISTRTTPCSTASPTRRGSCSRSRSATSPGRGTRCRSRAGVSSSRGRTSCTRSRRGARP